MKMVKFYLNNFLYAFDERELVRYLPSAIVADGLRRGKAFRRRASLADRESKAGEMAAIQRDRIFSIEPRTA